MRLALWLAFFALNGCALDLHSRCDEAGDCPTGFYCGGEFCYPGDPAQADATGRADGATADQLTPDQQPPDQAPVDGQVGDAAQPDRAVLDMLVLDLAPPDMTPPDMADPDLAPPDMDAADMGAADMAAPDLAPPDMAAPDLAVPTCDDGVQNGDETGVDCGGPACRALGQRCFDDGACAVPADCMSGVCARNTCQAPTCDDGLRNGDEADVDCAGGCAPCEGGAQCAENDDCLSRLCAEGQCAEVCANGAQDDALGETDVDCGGPLCGGCGAGLTCGADADCAPDTPVCTADLSECQVCDPQRNVGCGDDQRCCPAAGDAGGPACLPVVGRCDPCNPEPDCAGPPRLLAPIDVGVQIARHSHMPLDGLAAVVGPEPDHARVWVAVAGQFRDFQPTQTGRWDRGGQSARGQQRTRFAVGDLDGDGLDDLVIGPDLNPSTVGVYTLGAPNAQLTVFNVGADAGRAPRIEQVLVADVDGDLDLDVITQRALTEADTRGAVAVNLNTQAAPLSVSAPTLLLPTTDALGVAAIVPAPGEPATVVALVTGDLDQPPDLNAYRWRDDGFAVTRLPNADFRSPVALQRPDGTSVLAVIAGDAVRLYSVAPAMLLAERAFAAPLAHLAAADLDGDGLDTLYASDDHGGLLAINWIPGSADLNASRLDCPIRAGRLERLRGAGAGDRLGVLDPATAQAILYEADPRPVGAFGTLAGPIRLPAGQTLVGAAGPHHHAAYVRRADLLTRTAGGGLAAHRLATAAGLLGNLNANGLDPAPAGVLQMRLDRVLGTGLLDLLWTEQRADTAYRLRLAKPLGQSNNSVGHAQVADLAFESRPTALALAELAPRDPGNGQAPQTERREIVVGTEDSLQVLQIGPEDVLTGQAPLIALQSLRTAAVARIEAAALDGDAQDELVVWHGDDPTPYVYQIVGGELAGFRAGLFGAEPAQPLLPLALDGARAGLYAVRPQTADGPGGLDRARLENERLVFAPVTDFLRPTTTVLGAGDVTADGRNELLTLAADADGTQRLYVDALVGGQLQAVAGYGPFAGAVRAVEVADHDGDGRPDVLVSLVDQAGSASVQLLGWTSPP